ncbi:MAG: adenylate/guanylate cyclase domain-containing protein [Gammaproteobacteria bacterium]|nr:adenylate/guanylate cyclase domain-containing protein [Gammaproteobacteria bacterium]
MAVRYRIPITGVTVFATSGLLVLTVGVVLILGFGQAAKTTRDLWTEQSEGLIDSMQRGLRDQLQPVREQALWVAEDIHDLSSMEELDAYMLGALAATPQVAGIAVIAEDGRSRRWGRQAREAISENWSDRNWFDDYIELVESAGRAGWREPIFTDTFETSTLLHDTPLYDASGSFIGIFAQIVPLQELSNFIATRYTDTGITPFVLYDRDFVLAHPLITEGSQQKPLSSIVELGDVILERIWTPDEEPGFIRESTTDIQGRGVILDDTYYLFLYRNVETYGPSDWTVGAYLNTDLLPDEQTAGIIRAAWAGLVVLVLAVFASVYVGRRVSIPIQTFVASAGRVETGDLDSIEPLGTSHIRELDDASDAFNHMVSGLRERRLVLDTLGRFVPEKIAGSLLASGGELEVQQTEATILFCDIEAFTRMTESLGPVKIVAVLNAYFSAMVDILERHDGVVTQFQGDAILATFNVPIPDPDHARQAIEAAREMLACVASRKFEGEEVRIRIGINTGPVVAGAIGAEGRLNYTVHGDAVNLAARLESSNKDYGTRLLVSAQTAALVPDCGLRPIGETRVRGQSSTIELFTLSGDN